MHCESIIRIKDLCFSYGETTILERVNLLIEKKAFIGIFGPNGGGKTTFLRLMMGFLKPSHGSIKLFDKDPIKSRLQIGYVPQVAKMDRQFPITSLEVVEMGLLSRLSRWGFLSKQNKNRAKDALEQVGMSAFAHRRFGSLSGGQAQRVLIARALVDHPSLLLLDEPTASVDPQAENEILKILHKLKGNMTILMVTHDLQTILDSVSSLICVHRQVHTFSPSHVCEHFGLGLYHTPLQKSRDVHV